MVISAIAIINAKRVWKGASAIEPNVSATYSPEVNAVLVEDGRIAFVGSTQDVLARYEPLAAQIHAAAAHAAAPVEGGRARTPSARVIDCAHTRCVYPGFIDSHVHFLDGGRFLLSPSFAHACGKEAFVKILRDFFENSFDQSSGAWLTGGGWSEAVVGCSPVRAWLDEVSTEVPIVLYSKDVHSCVMNTAALRAAHIIPGANDGDDTLITKVEGGEIERDENGELNGVLRDNAMNAAKYYFPRTDTRANQTKALETASNYLLSLGFTSVFSMMSTAFKDNINEIAFLREMEAAGSMRMRVRYGIPCGDIDAMVSQFYEPVRAQAAQRQDAFTQPFRFTSLPPTQGGGYLVLGAVKLFSDGSLSSRTAAMTRPYFYDVRTEGDIDSDLEDAAIDAILARAGPGCKCGLLTLSRDELRQDVRAAHSHNLQCVAHAIGDRACATVNKVLSESAEWLQSQANSDAADPAMRAFQLAPRSRVEHFQHTANVEKEVRRMSTHGIIASMQPCHLLFDGDYIDSLLGAKRKDKSYIWGTLLSHKIRVDLGSDWPVAPADINDGLRGAVTRVPDVMATVAAEQAGHANASLKRYHDVWNGAECISMDAALRTYTYESAYGAFLDDVLGTVEVGKYADLTIWSDDWLDESGMVPMGVSEAKWWPAGAEPRVQYTIVGGVVEYESDAAAH